MAALKASLKPKATVKRDGAWTQLDAAEVVPGDLVLLGAGSAVPADCLINEGQIDVDQSGLTGESLPVTMYRGDSVKMGSTVTRGEVEGTVEVRVEDEDLVHARHHCGWPSHSLRGPTHFSARRRR